MNVVFFGTGEIAYPTLKYLMDNHQVVSIYTKDPNNACRKGKDNIIYKLSSKELLRTPTRLNDEINYIKSLNADIGIVFSYGLIIPQELLNIFPYGCINVHPSLLPRWRGSAPIQRAIEAGDKEYGLSIIKMDAGVDTGNLYSQIIVYNGSSPNAEILYKKCAEKGAEEIKNFFEKYINTTPIPQKLEGITYAKKIEKYELLLDVNKCAEELVCKINAFTPLYTPYINIFGKKVKVYTAVQVNDNSKLKIGDVFVENKNTLIIKCNNSCLSLLKVQPENSNIMDVKDFINGYLKTY